jgi:hypothetical protein
MLLRLRPEILSTWAATRNRRQAVAPDSIPPARFLEGGFYVGLHDTVSEPSAA